MSVDTTGFSRRALSNRGVIVRSFRAWIDEDPARALTPLSFAKLAKEIPHSAGTIKKYFPLIRTNDDWWGALCWEAAAVAVSSDTVPTELALKARAYEQIASATPRPKTPAAGISQRAFTDWTDDELRRSISEDEIAESVAATRALVRRLDNSMRARPDDGGSHTADALAAANEIIELGERALAEIRAIKSVPPSVRYDFIDVVESTADAYRLRSRDPKNEQADLYRLEKFRASALPVTKAALGPIKYIMSSYHRDAVEALRAGVGQIEIDAAVRAVDRLAETIASAADPESKEKFRRELDEDAVAALTARIASYAIAYPDFISSHLDDCARKVRQLLLPGQTRNELNLLLDQAGLSVASDRRHTLITPYRLLGLARYRGIGDILIARSLVELSLTHPELDEDERASTVSQRLAMYIDDPTSPKERAGLQHRAVHYYGRAIDWLRRSGAAGKIREIAERESEDLREQLLTAAHEVDYTPVITAIDLFELESQLDLVFTAAILSPLTVDSNNREVASRLASKLALAARALSNPDGPGLRTDLAPVVLGAEADPN